MKAVTIASVKARAEADARTFGYYLTPDPELLQGLLDGLRVNEERYGYPACPCRLASANLEFDRDIVCPCDYRDPDVQEFGACYCRLYVNKEVHESKELPAVPERRPMEKQALAYSAAARPGEKKTQQATTMESPKEGAGVTPQLKPKLWYCRQCGYVVYRDEPPYVCPICKAKKELFAEITIRIDFLG